jgi:glycosyltransferase involved in cell wall biosynthesis
MHLIIADHTLKDYQGHSFEYCKSVREIAIAKGWKVTTLGTNQITTQIQKELHATAFFKHDFFHHYPVNPLAHLFPSRIANALQSRWNYRQHSNSLFTDLCKILPDCNNSEPILILFPTFSFNDIIGITRFAEKLAPSSNTQIAMVQHFTSKPNLEKDHFPHRLYTHSLNYLSQSPARNRINLFADSQDLTDEYKSYIDKPFKVLPIPHTQYCSEQPSIKTPSKKLVIGYLGDARTNKGFHLIPEAINHVSTVLGNDAVYWEIQANIRKHQEWQTVLAVNLLKNMPNTTLHHTPLNTNAYHKLMANIDIFMLPYTLENYHSQTSGIFSETRGLGKVSVVTKGTWMAQEITNHGGGILCAPEDSKSLGDALVESVKAYPQLKVQAEFAKAKWCEFHNSENYITELISDIPFKA